MLAISTEEIKSLNNNPTFLSDVMKECSILVLIAKDEKGM